LLSKQADVFHPLDRQNPETERKRNFRPESRIKYAGIPSPEWLVTLLNYR
jgi:hypothetical protein